MFRFSFAAVFVLLFSVELLGQGATPYRRRPTGAVPDNGMSNSHLSRTTGEGLISAATVGEHQVSLPYCLVSLIYEAKVPAQQGGVLVDIQVREGQQVRTGDLIAKIDDRRAKMQQEVAAYKLDVAKEEAGNDIRVRYATAAAKVAEAEYYQGIDANRKVPGTVPQAEIRRLLLNHKKSVLEIEQAQITQRIAGKELSVSKAELDAAAQNLGEHSIKMPWMSRPEIDEQGNVIEQEKGAVDKTVRAQVVEIYVHAGEWVEPGTPVLHVVRMDRLRIEGFLNVKNVAPSQVVSQPVQIQVALAKNVVKTFRGKVSFVSPLVRAGGDYQVWAEVENQTDQRGLWILRPGLPAKMTIQLRQ